MRGWLGVLLAVAVMVAGCASRGVTTPNRTEESESNLDGGSKVETPEVIPPTPTSMGDPISCSQGETPTKETMTKLLARVSMHAPLDYLTGPALEIEKQWLEMERLGWPEASGTWVGHAWFALDIAPGAADAWIVRLQHGEVERTEDRFEVLCNEGRWQVKQYARGVDGAYLRPAQALPGQGGELSVSLAEELIKAAGTATGPWFAQVATGNALSWGRFSEVYRARGWNAPLLPWTRPIVNLTITAIDEAHAEALLEGKRPFLRFEKVDGLWKIENFTEGGKWVGPPKDVRLNEPGWVFDPPFGVLLGNTDMKVIEERFGAPDVVKAMDSGTVYIYSDRLIEVAFDAQGKVSAFSMKTGAPNSGVRIGSPVALWELIYGPYSATAKSGTQPLPRYVAKDGRIVEILLGY